MKALLCVFAFIASLNAADRCPVDWHSLETQILQHYLALLRIDTSNPPGN